MTAAEFEAIAGGRHADPFSLLGPHQKDDGWQVTTFQPLAEKVSLIELPGGQSFEMQKIHDGGVFAVQLDGSPDAYRLAIQTNGTRFEIDDAYRFGSCISEFDEYLINEGTHQALYKILGAHPVCRENVDGVSFAVWAPNALSVCVAGDFNDWHPCIHPMRKHPATGIFELFIPGAAASQHYQYRINGADGVLKSDPFGQYCEVPPARASKVYRSNYQWGDKDWMRRRENVAYEAPLNGPMCIYEVHAGSWRRGENGQILSYRELADRLIPYVKDMGFTHVEFMPLAAHPFDGSWGYQPIGLFAADPRFGEPDDLRYLIDQCHQHGIGVIVDWVAAHFPRDEHGLAQFDGTHLYEHADSRRSAHPDWGTLEFNFGRTEVASYLIANAVFWINEFHVDMLRVDAVASMLYLDYSRESGQWVANESGGNEDLEAVAFLKRLNQVVHEQGGMTIAEESTSWPMVSRPTEAGGLGFTYKWNMGWMNDTLQYMSSDPVHRKHHHHHLTFGLLYAFSENFILPLSHDEVVHGKRSLLDRMPGNDVEKFAGLRLYYCFQYAHPGKKLLFMGNEFAQGGEWNYQQSLDWHLCGVHWHAGVQQMVKDLNQTCRTTPALYERDFSESGFTWLINTSNDESLLAFIRWPNGAGKPLVAIFNFTPVDRENVRVGVPQAGTWVQTINSGKQKYGGSDNNHEEDKPPVLTADSVPWNEQNFSLQLSLPGLTAVMYQPTD